tara:strand:- start:463 stop:1029 length:567 start_codon:yes stop_codon:yes gene_type:complete
MINKQKKTSTYLIVFLMAIILTGCGESQPPEISSFLEQDTGALSDFKDCEGFKNTELSHEDYHDLVFKETPSVKLYKYNTASGNNEIHVFGPVQNKIDGKIDEDFNNYYLLNRYKSKDGMKWSQLGKASIYERTMDSDTGKVISYEEDEQAAFGMAFFQLALLASSNSALEKCMKQGFEDLNLEDAFK